MTPLEIDGCKVVFGGGSFAELDGYLSENAARISKTVILCGVFRQIAVEFGKRSAAEHDFAAVYFKGCHKGFFSLVKFILKRMKAFFFMPAVSVQKYKFVE